MSWHEIEHDGVLANYGQVTIRLFVRSERPCWLEVDCEGDVSNMHEAVSGTPTLKVLSAFEVAVEWQRHHVNVAVVDGETMYGVVSYDGVEIETFETNEPGWFLSLPHAARPSHGPYKVRTVPGTFRVTEVSNG